MVNSPHISILLTAVLILLLVGCAGTPPPVSPPGWGATQFNDCLPMAAAMCQRLQAEDIESNVLIYTRPATRAGHAITVYMYPPGYNQFWGWDENTGSRRIIAFRNYPLQTARAWEGQHVDRAEYLHANWKKQRHE